EGTAAMIGSFGARLGELEEAHKQGAPLNWDLATYPVFPQAPNKARVIGISALAISEQTAHADQAFQVLATLSEKEVTVPRVRQGRLASLKDNEVKMAFGADLKSLEGKNIAALFKLEAASPSPFTEHNQIVVQALRQSVK